MTQSIDATDVFKKMIYLIILVPVLDIKCEDPVNINLGNRLTLKILK